MTAQEWAFYAFAALVGIVGAARIVRLVTADTFPPSVWLRIKYEDRAGEQWGKMLTCPWCFGPWVTLVTLILFLLANSAGGNWLAAWLLFYGWMAASYAVSWVVYHDED